MNSAVLMLLFLTPLTLGTAYITQLASAEGVVKQIEMGLYWDEGCTNPVSLIDFGMIAKGESRVVTLWLKNEGTDKGLVSWDSANFNPSSNGIAETWQRKVGNFVYIANWNKKMKAGDLWEIRYTIQVAQDAQGGWYCWDLTVCLIVSEKISCLYVPCSLAVAQ